MAEFGSAKSSARVIVKVTACDEDEVSIVVGVMLMVTRVGAVESALLAVLFITIFEFIASTSAVFIEA